MYGAQLGGLNQPCTRSHGIPVTSVLDVATELDVALTDDISDPRATAKHALQRLYALVSEHGEAFDQYTVAALQVEEQRPE